MYIGRHLSFFFIFLKMCAGSVADANDTWMNHLDQYPPGWEEEDMMVDEDRLYIQGDFQLNRRWPNKELVYVIDPTLEECRTQIDTAIQQVRTNEYRSSLENGLFQFCLLRSPDQGILDVLLDLVGTTFPFNFFEMGKTS